MVLRIRLLGKPSIVDDSGSPRPIRGFQAWAVLARILLSDRPLSRRQLAAEFFPEALDPLGSLRSCLASLRRAIGPDTFPGDPVEANLPRGTIVDVWNIADGDFDIAEAGELLEGAEPKASAVFATWLLIERERTAGLIDTRQRRDILVAIAAGDYGRAIRLAELAVHRRPTEEGFHILLAKSLVLAGRPEAALKHVEATEAAFLAEIGEKPTSALRAAARAPIWLGAESAPTRSVVEALVGSGEAALSAGAVDSGVDCLRRAASAAESMGDTYLLARALAELGSALVHSVRGQDDEGAVLLRQAAELARQSGAASIASRALRELGYVEALAGRRPAAAGLLEAALQSSEGDLDALAGIYSITAFNLVDWGKVEEGLEQYELSLDHARRAGNRRREIWSLGLGGWGMLAAKQPEGAIAWLEQALAACDEIRWIAFRPWPLAILAEARLTLGHDTGVIRRELDDAFALSCQLGDPCWEAAAARAIALAHAVEGDHNVARQWLEAARIACVRVSDPYAGLLVQILSDLADLDMRTGKPDPGAASARAFLSVAARTHADGHLQRAMDMVGEAGKAGKVKA